MAEPLWVHRAGRQMSRVYAKLPPIPTTPGDTNAAMQYHMAIQDILDRDDVVLKGDPEKLTRHERQYAQTLARRWMNRIIGADKRWTIIGIRAGRLSQELEDGLRPAPSEDWERPLSRGETGFD